MENKRARTEKDAVAIDLTARAFELGIAVADLDTEDDLHGNAVAFEAIGKTSASILTMAGQIHQNEEWIVDQANETLRYLIALPGWRNRLGPRYE
ncbi:MAG TPA: hypothetical protein VK501_22360 [Baekduia sp.]|uniref:hypothetical protein n=1 Tax=Baekduia sp. TaxID=2600305 RepID=UPI002CA63D72|nr:hypothetical protein [Baekduia sp.]HMJ36665.1 hypothetical protein [Baekduia sp.]